MKRKKISPMFANDRSATRAARVGLLIVGAIAAARANALADGGDAYAGVTGKSAGVAAGLILAALVLYGLWLLAAPLLRADDRGPYRALAVLIALFAVKAPMLFLTHGFATDIGTFESWALRIAALGPAQTYARGYFLDYPPGYLYWLWAAGAAARAFGVSNGLWLKVWIETPPLVGDLLLAWAVFLFVRRMNRPRSAWAAMLLVALNPAFLFDSVVWGENDAPLALAMFLSAALIADGEFEIGWGVAALAALMKPQGLMLLPVLGVWTLLRFDARRWWRAALCFVAVIVIGAAPFQLGHGWDLLPQLYLSGAAYYHETTVNAFNLMALLGGVRRPDSTLVFGMSCFKLGMALLVPLYLYAAWIVWRSPSRRNLLFASFITIFGCFVLAPRMHERYQYAALAFAAPLALAEPAMLAIFGLVTVTCFVNLAYVLHILNTVVFMGPRDAVAMTTALANVAIFAGAIVYDSRRHRRPAETAAAASSAQGASAADGNAEEWLGTRFGWIRRGLDFPPPSKEFMAPFAWRSLDSLLLGVITAVAGVLRFWRLSHPPELVFDEVHFVGQARHYLHHERFLDPHPPLAKLLSALGILMFGDHSWAWRLGTATLGTAMVGITYLLARRMFKSRLAATLAASFIALDGFFIVDSRIAVIDIVYLTLAALSYLFLFRLMQDPEPNRRLRNLLFMGAALGLCLGSKLYVPGIVFLLAGGYALFAVMRPDGPGAPALAQAVRTRRAIGAAFILGSLGGIFYLACFIPHYTLGWWGGISDLFHYYKDVMWYEKSVATATHPYASPWWSWPLMLRPVAYWQNFPAHGNIVATIWGAGNPVLWWGVIPAITIALIRVLERPEITRAFVVVGYFAFWVIWIPIGRILFLYHYMPSVYFGYLALAGTMADCWRGDAEWWETIAFLAALFAPIVIGLGHIASVMQPAFIPERYRLMAGVPLWIALAIGWALTVRNRKACGRLTCVAYLGCAAAVTVYFMPVWLGTPISRAGYYARMWFQGPGLRNWI